MFITIQLPIGATYSGTDQWWLDPNEEHWCVCDLLADVNHATGGSYTTVKKGGVALEEMDDVFEVLDPNDTVTFE